MKPERAEFSVDCYGNVYVDILDDNGKRLRGVIESRRARSLIFKLHRAILDAERNEVVSAPVSGEAA